MNMHVIHLDEFKPVLPGARHWITVQRAWMEHPERRQQMAANLRRFVRAVNGVVSQPRLPH